MDENLPKESHELERWTLIRDTAVLQFKLIVDGLRDFLLVPLSLIAAIASLATSKDGVPGPHFYRLLQVGKQAGNRFIDALGVLGMAIDQTAVLVPHVARRNLNVTHARFGKSTGKQTLPAIVIHILVLVTDTI